MRCPLHWGRRARDWSSARRVVGLIPRSHPAVVSLRRVPRLAHRPGGEVISLPRRGIALPQAPDACDRRTGHRGSVAWRASCPRCPAQQQPEQQQSGEALHQHYAPSRSLATAIRWHPAVICPDPYGSPGGLCWASGNWMSSISCNCRSRGCRSRGCRSRGCRSRGCRSHGCRSHGCRSHRAAPELVPGMPAADAGAAVVTVTRIMASPLVAALRCCWPGPMAPLLSPAGPLLCGPDAIVRRGHLVCPPHAKPRLLRCQRLAAEILHLQNPRSCERGMLAARRAPCNGPAVTWM
jgi:hypothetical protein